MGEEKPIKCELCNKNDAILHVQQIMGGEIKEVHICSDCAKLHGISDKDNRIDLSLTELLTGLINITASEKSDTYKSCPGCGLDFETLRKDGKLGCVECFHTFKREIEIFIENMGIPPHHKGRLPKKLDYYKTILIDQAKLKTELKNALKNEDYEKAAILRDKMKDLDEFKGQ